jgi:hypothetical protein
MSIDNVLYHLPRNEVSLVIRAFPYRSFSNRSVFETPQLSFVSPESPESSSFILVLVAWANVDQSKRFFRNRQSNSNDDPSIQKRIR